MTQRGRDVGPRRARTIARRSCAGPIARRRLRGRPKRGKLRVPSASGGVPRAPPSLARPPRARPRSRAPGPPATRARRTSRLDRGAAAERRPAPRRRRDWRRARPPAAAGSAAHAIRRPAARATPRSSPVLTGLSRVAGLVREIVAAALLRHAAGRVGLHARLPGPEPDPRARRRRRALLGLRARLLRAAGAEAPARGDPRRERARRAAAARPHGRDAAVHPRRAVADAAVHRHAGARRPDHRPVARAVPDRRAARAQRPRGRASSTRTTTSRSRRSRRWCGTW